MHCTCPLLGVKEGPLCQARRGLTADGVVVALISSFAAGQVSRHCCHPDEASRPMYSGDCECHEREHAAELLRATATQSAAEKTEQAIVVPPVLAFPKSCREKNARQAVFSSRDVPPSKAVEDLHAACKRLTTAEPHHKKKDPPPESAIAMRILELHDRFGGLIK